MNNLLDVLTREGVLIPGFATLLIVLLYLSPSGQD